MRLAALILGALILATLLPNAPARAQNNPARLDEARAQAAAGHKDQAIETYRQLLSAQPDNVAALAECSDLLEASGRWREAVPLLTRLVDLQPANAPALYQLGRMKSWTEGGLSEAVTLLRRAAAADPGNPDYQVAHAEALGRSPQNTDASIQILRSVLAAHPNHVEGRRLLALLLGRQHKTAEALQVLEPLLQQPRPAVEDYQAQAAIQETAGDMKSATSAYENILSIDPNNLAAITRLAEILSWNQSTRSQSSELFERGLKLDPENVSLGVSYAELLSWNQSTRSRAMQMFDRVLAQDSGNPRALNGKAQLLAWSGHSEDALALYDKVFATDPNNTDALRGKAEILNWRGRYAQAHDLLARAHTVAPDDTRTNLEMARANVGLHRYSDARDDLDMAPALQGADSGDVLQDIHRGLGTYLELGYTGRRNERQLDFNRIYTVLSFSVNNSNRLSFDYSPTLYNTILDDFNSNHFGVALDSEPSDELTTHAEFSANQYPGRPVELNTDVNIRYRVRESLTLQGGFERQPVEESLLSTRGLDIGTIFTGQVQSNLASLGASYNNSAHHYDASLTFSGGAYTGHALDANSRWGVDFNIGKSVRGSAPYIRISYGVSFLSFGHDADFQPGQAPLQFTGGYYSPTAYLLNYGGIGFAHKFGRKLEWDANGTAGVQNAETTGTQFSNAQFASTFATHVVWHVSPSDDIRGGYDYLNTFNAFHRHLFFIGWRHYF